MSVKLEIINVVVIRSFNIVDNIKMYYKAFIITNSKKNMINNIYIYIYIIKCRIYVVINDSNKNV